MKIYKIEMICATENDLRIGVNCSIRNFLDNMEIIDIQQEKITKKKDKNLSLFNEEIDIGDLEEYLK